MFFAPPKVKSLSRYAEYGGYMGHRHFLLMLAIAFTAHIALIAVYSMTPAQEIVRIPVRALNIKLSGGSSANGIAMPHSPPLLPAIEPLKESAPPPKAEDEGKPMGETIENDAGEAMEDALKGKESKPVAPKHVPPATAKTAHKEAKKSGRAPGESTLATPKKYFREVVAGGRPARKHGGTGDGNGSAVNGEAGGKEAINRYTQLIAQAIKNHESLARATYRNAAQSQASIKGQTVMRLRIDREGHILDKGVEHTSGNELVDEVAKAMVEASDPLPAVPADYPSDSQLEFLIAVQVDLAKE